MDDVASVGESYKIFLTCAHFVLGPVIIDALRLRCRSGDLLRRKLYVPILIRAFGKKKVYWILVINVFLYDG